MTNKYEIYDDDRILIGVLNKHLINKQKCIKNLNNIKLTHKIKYQIYKIITKTNNKKALNTCGIILMKLEFYLQSLWNFPQDFNFHKIWEYPKCTCPIMDNKDRYPYGHYINANCPLHGK